MHRLTRAGSAPVARQTSWIIVTLPLPLRVAPHWAAGDLAQASPGGSGAKVGDRNGASGAQWDPRRAHVLQRSQNAHDTV